MASGIGFIASTVQMARDFVFDPVTSGRFGDAKIIDYLRTGFQDVVTQINRSSQFKLRARINVPLVDGQQLYSLPATIGTFEAFEERDSEDNLLCEIKANHPLSPYGPNFTIEGPTLRFSPLPRRTATFVIVYVPSGEAWPFEAIAAANEHTSTTALIPIGGPVDVNMKVDYRENAYAGYVFRSLSATYTGAPAHVIVQDRIVTGFAVYDAAQRAAVTFAPALDPAPDTTVPMTFELIPDGAYRMRMLLGLRAARFMASVMVDHKKRAALDAEFAALIREARLQRSQADARSGQSFKRTVRGRRGLR